MLQLLMTVVTQPGARQIKALHFNVTNDARAPDVGISGSTTFNLEGWAPRACVATNHYTHSLRPMQMTRGTGRPHLARARV